VSVWLVDGMLFDSLLCEWPERRSTHLPKLSQDAGVLQENVIRYQVLEENVNRQQYFEKVE